MKTIITLTIITFIAVCETGFSQNVYRTINGTMQSTVIYNDTPLVFSSNELLIYLDYENAEFLMKMDKSTFKTGNDSIDNILQFNKYDIIQFKGKLGLNYINTKGHPPLTFEVEGKISTNEESVIIGKGKLEHMMEGSFYSCLLSMSFYLKLSDIGLLPDSLNVKDEIQVEIIQTVLNRETD